MVYALEKITTVAMCDTLLEVAAKDRDNLERKRQNLQASVSTFDTRTADIGSELMAIQARLEIYTNLYEVLPDGKEKLNAYLDLKRAEARKALLDKQVVDYNVFALIDKQVDHNLLETQVSIVDLYIGAVRAKRTALGGV
jgi:hypothetical protein